VSVERSETGPANHISGVQPMVERNDGAHVPIVPNRERDRAARRLLFGIAAADADEAAFVARV